MKRATLRAFKCRQGLHRRRSDDKRFTVRVCRDCRTEQTLSQYLEEVGLKRRVDLSFKINYV